MLTFQLAQDDLRVEKFYLDHVDSEASAGSCASRRVGIRNFFMLTMKLAYNDLTSEKFESSSC